MFEVGVDRNKKIMFIVNTVLAIIFPIILLLLWQRGVDSKVIKAALLPSPTSLAKCFWTNLTNGKLIRNIFASLKIVLLGFAIGGGLGVLLGFLTGLIKPIKSALSIVLSILRPIPIIAIVPVFILCMGIGTASKAAVIAVGSFWPIFINTGSGIVNTDRKLVEVAYVYRIPKKDVIFKIVLPSAVPMILTGIRLGISAAWMSVVAAEMIAASEGIGYLITISKEQAKIPLMYVSVLVIGLIGLAIDRGIAALDNAYLKKTRGTGR